MDTPDVMRAAVLSEPGRIEVVDDRPVPAPARDDVLVRVAAVGVCGSDTHYFRHGRIGSVVVDGPLVLGHEVSGHIVGVGAEVSPDRVGERVSLEPQRPCTVCEQCRSGRYNLCPDMRFFATPPVDGALCDYVTVPASFAHPVRDTLTDDAAALLEPVSVAVAAMTKARTQPSSRVLIAGAGPVGLMCAQTALAFGAREVVIVEPDPDRRTVARELTGATAIDPSGDDVDGLDVDAFVDCSGAPSAIQRGIESVRPAGTVTLVGLGATHVELPVQTIQNRELEVTGVFRYANTWPLAEHLVGTGQVDVDALVTGHFRLEDTADALDADRTPGSLKAVVTVAG